MILRLDLDGVLFDLKIEHYEPSSKRVSGDSWCNVEIILDDRKMLRGKTEGTILESGEVDDLCASLRKLLNNEYKEDYIKECTEPDLTFCFHPTCNQPSRAEISEKSLELILHLWNDKGKPSHNSITLFFNKYNVEAFLKYLKLITNTIDINNPEIQAMIEKGELYGDVYKYFKPNKPTSPTSSKRDSSLQTITQLWGSKSDPLLIVRKEKWTPNFCFAVRKVEGSLAKGITFNCVRGQKAEIVKVDASYKISDPVFRLLNSNELWMRDSVCTALTPPAKQPFNTTVAQSRNAGPQIKIGSTVVIRDCDSNEKNRYQIVSSQNKNTYRTMGYRTKKYVETTQVSEADGINTISDLSDLGKALIDKRVGDTISVRINDVFKHYEVLKVLI